MSTKSERLKELSNQYGLSGEDFQKIHNNIIVKRTGVEKIAAQANIDVEYTIVALDLPNKIAAVEAMGYKYNDDGEIEGKVQTYGESCKYNTTNDYPLAMAEKRAYARAVLKLTEFYSHGVYSEDESDDFKK